MGSTADGAFDVLHQVFHNKALLRTDMHNGPALAQMVGQHRTDRGDARAGQPLRQDISQAAPLGDLVQTIDLRRTGEQQDIHRAAIEPGDQVRDTVVVD